jgi:GT2 family glycosyltransferase
MTMPDAATGRPLSVITVTYNSSDVLTGFLDSLVTGLAGIENAEVVVADNASTDGSADLALNHPIRPRVIRTGRNGGYSAGINAAMATIPADSDILVLNPDIRLLLGSVQRLAGALADPSVGIVVPRILTGEGETAYSVRREPSLVTGWSDALLGSRLACRLGLGEIVGDPGLYRDGGPIEWATGAALMIASRARCALGEWDESFFLYSEEVDYLRRARGRGFSVRYVPNAQCIHIGGAYHDNSRLSALMTSNRIRYYRRHHGPVSTAAFRLGLLVESGMRFALGPGHRAAFRAALTTVATSSERPVRDVGYGRLVDEGSGS